MKHRVMGRKLGRTSAHRLAVLRNLSTELFERERIRTTLMKAKELRPFAERLITLSRRGTLHARRRAARHVTRPEVLQKLFDTISARFAERPGGYTRIVKLGPRRGDHAEMALVELIGSEPKTPAAEEKKEKKALGRIRQRLSRGKAATPAGKKEAEAGKAEEEAKAGKTRRTRRTTRRKAGEKAETAGKTAKTRKTKVTKKKTTKAGTRKKKGTGKAGTER
jgi:large subunit ribosomal protein L17